MKARTQMSRVFERVCHHWAPDGLLDHYIQREEICAFVDWIGDQEVQQ
jgi:hypothetical protein